MKPRWITFTGLDAQTDMGRVEALTKRYPTEWGVLFGGRLGKNRYPPRDVADEAEKRGLPMSMHLCGAIAAEANSGYAPQDYRAFRRIQVNRAEGQYDMHTLSQLAAFIDRDIIVQHRARVFAETLSGIVPLQDTSGGKGKAASFWATPFRPDQLVGYAGGLNPDNVADAVARMPATNFWIDMETGVRTDDWLDLDKCEAVCKAIYG